MLVIDESAAGRLDAQGAYFDGSLELLRELAVTSDLDAALPRLSAIVSKMLPHDALGMTCFDQRGHLVVNASTAEVPDLTPSEADELIIEDLRSVGVRATPPRTRPSGWSKLATARSWKCRPASRTPSSVLRSGRSGRWRSIARNCRSPGGSRTTSDSRHSPAHSEE